MRKTTAGEYFSPRDFQRGREWWLNVVMGEQDHLYVRTTKRLAQRVPPQSPNSERTHFGVRFLRFDVYLSWFRAGAT